MAERSKPTPKAPAPEPKSPQVEKKESSGELKPTSKPPKKPIDPWERAKYEVREGAPKRSTTGTSPKDDLANLFKGRTPGSSAPRPLKSTETSPEESEESDYFADQVEPTNPEKDFRHLDVKVPKKK